MTRVARSGPMNLRAPKVFAIGLHRVGTCSTASQSSRAKSGTRWNASLPCKGVAWLLSCALVHAGEAGLQRIDAGGLPVKRGQEVPVVGVQLLQDGQVPCVYIVLENG